MKNKLLVLLVTLMLLTNIPFPSIPPARATEWHVYPGESIQEAINAASSGDTIIIHSGTYIEGPQLVINKSLTITGTEASTTIVKPAGDTGSSGDARGWFLVDPGVALNLSSLTLDASGHNIYQAIRHRGQGTIINCIFKNIVYPGYQGFAIVAFGGNVDVFNCTFLNIGRVGILYFGIVVTDSEFSGNSYTGKGDGDWLDYGVEVGAGAHVVISGNAISECTGIASVDNSTSAGILVTTYYGAGSQATIINNDISGCSYGIAVGYDETDTSSVVAHMNNLYNNDCGVDSTAPTVDASFNWWGDASGPYHNVTNPGGLGNNVSDYIDYSPWLAATFETTPRTYHVNPTGTIQEAINEASPSDTIIVHDGIYDEQVVVNKSLTLQGFGDTTIIQPSGTGKLTSFYTLGTQEGAFWNGHKLASIISVQDVGTAGVTVENLKVDGVNVDGLPTGANYVVGISYGETAGTIDDVTVVNMNSVPIETRTYGMWLDAVSTSVSIEVKNSRISYYNKNGITARGAVLTANIHDNTIIGPGDGGVQVPNGIVFAFEAGGTARYNDISALHYTLGTWLGFGIMGYVAKDGLIIEYNVLHDIDAGIGPSSYSLIRYNEIYDCYLGIELEWYEECAYNNIECNEIHDNYYGIHLLGPGSPYYTGPGDEPGPGNKASYNNIFNNTEGVRNWDTTQIFEAENNWWGHPTGPYNPELNPSGKGDKISNYVDFEPWLLEPYPPPIPVETLLYIDPSKVEHWTPSYNNVFKVNLEIANVINLTCYEFKLYWNTTLLDLDYALIVEIWPLQIKWEDINESLGRYWLGVTAQGEQKFTGNATLVELYFKIKYDPIYPNNVYSLLNLNETVLGDASEPTPQPIVHMVHDGEYWLYSTKPKMKIEPSTSTSKKLGKVFSVNITVQDVVNLYDFDFWLYYNTTLLDIYSPYVQLGPLMSGATVYIFEWNDDLGCVHFAARLTSPAPPVNGSGTIAIVTFRVTAASVWPDPDLECTLSLENTKLKTIGGIEVPHDEVDGLYRYTPVIGDLNSDGTVDLDDLYIISLAYGSKPGDPNWNRIADLNRDNIVNVLDLRTAARHFGEDC